MLKGLRAKGEKNLESAAREYNQAVTNGYSIEYVYAFCGPDHRDVTDAARQFSVSEAGNIPSRFCKLMDLQTLKMIHEESINQSTRVPSCEISFSGFFEESGDYGDAVVTTIEGEQLRGLYEKYGDRLFDRNVRLFLGAEKVGSFGRGIEGVLNPRIYPTFSCAKKQPDISVEKPVSVFLIQATQLLAFDGGNNRVTVVATFFKKPGEGYFTRRNSRRLVNTLLMDHF